MDDKTFQKVYKYFERCSKERKGQAVALAIKLETMKMQSPNMDSVQKAFDQAYEEYDTCKYFHELSLSNKELMKKEILIYGKAGGRIMEYPVHLLKN